MYFKVLQLDKVFFVQYNFYIVYFEKKVQRNLYRNLFYTLYNHWEEVNVTIILNFEVYTLPILCQGFI